MLEVQYLQTVLEHGSGFYRPLFSFESSPSAAPSGQYCQVRKNESSKGKRRPVVFLKNGGGKLYVKTIKERTKERLNEETKCENALS